VLTWNLESYGWKEWAPIVAHYYALISQVDDAIGRVLRALDASGEADNTIVIFTSDHGDMCGSHRMMDKHCVMYDDIVHVPLIVRWPGRVAPGSVCGQFVCNMLDLAPSIPEMTNSPVAPEASFHGRSLLPLLDGKTPEDWPQEVVSTYNGQQFGLYIQRMIRTREWKYIWNPTDVDELYHLESDPYELHNRIADPQVAGLLSELRKKLREVLIQQGDRTVNNHWVANQLLNGKKLAC
jgi:arylsulfatase A-like enzyme